MNKKIKKMLILELGIIFLVLIIFIIINSKIVNYMPECIIHKHTGLLCPGCGGTRSAINFMQGNFKQSFMYHPIFFITFLYLIFVNFLYIINSFKKKEILTFLYPKEKFWKFFIIIILIFTLIRNI